MLRKNVSCSPLRKTRIESAGDDSTRTFLLSGTSNWRMHTIRADKQLIWVRLDRDVWEWLKSYGEGYSSRLNGILRTVIENPRRGA